MVSFTVNGQNYSVESETRLISFLRLDLGLTSVKDGCSEGACGTCTVLIDGISTKACSLLTKEVNGKEIITVEGLSEREKKVYKWAFGEAGAVQCGYCIPGMIICAKSLLDKNLNPTEKEIRHAIRNNICRCTGYVKIVKAIELAAKAFRDNCIPDEAVDWKVGQSVHRVDVEDKVTGKAIYPDDINVKGMLYVSAVRSKYPRAKILGIDVSEAMKYEGVTAVYTADDIPGNHKVGHLKQDWPALIGIGEVTNYVGDAVALVVAETNEIARKGSELVKVSYEVLPFVSSPEESAAENAPLLHPDGNLLGETHLDRGNAEKAIADSDFSVSGTFTTPWTEHAFLETECAVSFPLEDGKVKIYSADQGVYDTRRETAVLLGIDEEKILVENCYVGGGFGGKEDVTVQHLSAMCALLTQKPCKMKLSRAESIIVHPKRHPMKIEMTMGCNREGIIQGLKAKIVSDTGAYASLGLPVLQRACTHACGPYNYSNFKIDGYAYYTNNPPAGAFRGFGVTQSCFAVETLLNRLADKAGIDHWQIRYRNAIRPGQALPNGQIVDESTGLVETLDAVKNEFYSNKIVGIACAMKNAGVGVGLPDWGRVKLEVLNNSVIIHCGGSCIGQGICTVLKQIVCDITNLSADKVHEEKANSFNAPDSGTTSGSRHTTVTGEAARRASLLIKKELDSGKTLKDLEGKEFYAEFLAKTDPFGSDIANPKSHVAYGYATQMCILDEKTFKISKMIAAHDVGVAINPKSVQGQIEGGVVMGMGFALRENYPIEGCIPKAKFASLGLFRADELPVVQSIVVERKGLDIACGGIGLGEITSIPTAPAISDAYHKLDGEERDSLPLNNTPYIPDENFSKTSTRRLVINKNARCIGCMECVHACAKAYHNSEESRLSYIQVRQLEGIGNQSGIKGEIIRPVVCTQCGLCAKACPIGAISQNRFGVWSVDLNICIGCGKCREACPLKLMVCENDDTSTKCISCGICVMACSMNVLSIGKNND